MYNLGFVRDINFMTSYLQVPPKQNDFHSTAQNNMRLFQEISDVSITKFLYNFGVAVANGNKTPKEVELFNGVDRVIQEISKKIRHDKKFPEQISWSFDADSCKMIDNWQYTELFDKWGDATWKKFATPVQH